MQRLLSGAMWTRTRRAAAFAALSLCLLASPAGAQDPSGDDNLGEEPPIELRDSAPAEPAEPEAPGRGSSSGARLADTGAEPGRLAVAGLGLLFAGAGLRLRLLRAH